MKRKIKLAISILSVTLSVFFLSLGVFALTERKIGISGTITFTSSALYFDYEIYKTSNNGYSSEELAIPYETSTAFASGSFDRDTSQENFNKSVQIGKVNLSDSNNAFAYKVILTSNELSKTLAVEIDVAEYISALIANSDWLTVILKHNNVITTDFDFQIAPEAIATFEFIFEVDPLYAPAEITLDFGSDFIIKAHQEQQYLANDTFVMSYDSELDGYVVHSTMMGLADIIDEVTNLGWEGASLYKTYTAFPAIWNDGVNGNKPVVKIGNSTDFLDSIYISDLEMFIGHIDYIIEEYVRPINEGDYGFSLNFPDFETFLQESDDDVIVYEISLIIVELFGIMIRTQELQQEAMLFFEYITNINTKKFINLKTQYEISLKTNDLNLFFFVGDDFFRNGPLKNAYNGSSTLELHENLKVIGVHAFTNEDGAFPFTKVDEIILPSTLEKIQKNAFHTVGVKKFVFKEISQTLTIDNGAFTRAGEDIEEIHFYNTNTNYFNFSLSDLLGGYVPSTITIYIPSGSLSAYQSWAVTLPNNVVLQER